MVTVSDARHFAHRGKFAKFFESCGEHLVVSSQEVKFAGPDDGWRVHLQDVIRDFSWEKYIVVLDVFPGLFGEQLVGSCANSWISGFILLIKFPLVLWHVTLRIGEHAGVDKHRFDLTQIIGFGKHIGSSTNNPTACTATCKTDLACVDSKLGCVGYDVIDCVNKVFMSLWTRAFRSQSVLYIENDAIKTDCSFSQRRLTLLDRSDPAASSMSIDVGRSTLRFQGLWSVNM